MMPRASCNVTLEHVTLIENGFPRSCVFFFLSMNKSPTLLLLSACFVLLIDKNAIYFVSTSKKGPEMYEFVCCNPKEKKQ